MATFIKIDSYTFGSPATSIEFTNIPQTYKDLCLFFNLRTTNAGNFGVPLLRFNGATTDANMNNRMLLADNASASNSTTSQGLVIRRCPGANVSADFFGSSVVWINDYAGSKHKYFSGVMGSPSLAQVSSSVGISGCVWSDTSAITSIKLLDDNASSFAQYSSVYLYGISNS